MNTSKTIPLSKGQVAIVDEVDFARVSAFRWCASNRAKTGGFIAVRRRRRSEPAGSQHVLLHRFILECGDDMEVDHINHDPLDNRRANLRVVTRSQNLANRQPWAKSGLKGVHATKEGKWSAKIRINGTLKHLGTFADAATAAAAYDQAANDAWGEFSFQNGQAA